MIKNGTHNTKVFLLKEKYYNEKEALRLKFEIATEKALEKLEKKYDKKIKQLEKR